MSDNEGNVSDEDDADLFGSDPEDQGSEVGNSVDLPALSLESLYVGPRLNTGNTVGDDEATFEHTGSGTDVSGAAGFDISEGRILSAMPSPLSIVQTENQEPSHRRDPVENGDLESAESDDANDDATDHSNIVADSEEVAAADQSPCPILQCESPQMSELNHAVDGDHKEQSTCEAPTDAGQEAGYEDVHIQSTDSKPSPMLASPIDKPSDCEEPSSTTSCENKISPRTELNETSQEPKPPVEPTQVTITQEHECEDTTAEELTNEVKEVQQSELGKTAPRADPRTSIAPMYTVEALFPVIYEGRASLRGSPTENAKVLPISPAEMSDKTPSRGPSRRLRGSNPDKSVVARLAALQAQLDTARVELTNAARTFKLQLSMAETDNKKLSKRNARLKNQLSVATIDLQRSNTEMAKLKTENELYAAKLPRLQAELLEETSQVDETQAQSLQTQLALTQLKARSHVLQTRNLALEAQNSKLNQQLREFQQQLQRKTAALQQQIEKAAKLEADMNELKATHIQEKLNWKSRMTTTVQRFERDKAKLGAELKSHDRKELHEAKDRAEKAVKKRQAAETSVAKLEAELKHCKHELSSANEAVQHHVTEIRTLESLLRKAHRTEATLRNDLAACKTKLRTLQDEKKRLLSRCNSMQPRRRRVERQIPVELLLPLTDSSDDDEGKEEDNQEQQCCTHCLTSIKTLDLDPPSPRCSECPELKAQLLQLQQDLRRIRALHATELNAQASVLDALLQQQQQRKRQLALM